MPDDAPAPPGHLATAGAEFWRATVAEWDIEPHLLGVLDAACVALDRIAQCRNRIRREGLTVPDKSGKPTAHPALAVERQAMRLHAQLVKALGLEDEPEPSPAVGRANKGGRPRQPSSFTPRRG